MKQLPTGVKKQVHNNRKRVVNLPVENKEAPNEMTK